MEGEIYTHSLNFLFPLIFFFFFFYLFFGFFRFVLFVCLLFFPGDLPPLGEEYFFLYS